jgi:hypothetical protein
MHRIKYPKNSPPHEDPKCYWWLWRGFRGLDLFPSVRPSDSIPDFNTLFTVLQQSCRFLQSSVHKILVYFVFLWPPNVTYSCPAGECTELWKEILMKNLLKSFRQNWCAIASLCGMRWSLLAPSRHSLSWFQTKTTSWCKIFALQ